MIVLIACEESQEVCKAFRALGHEAYSCDLKPCSGGHPEWHKQYDCRIAIQERFWDLIIFHPDCTAMAVSGNRYYAKGKPLYHKREQAIDWTLETWSLIRKQTYRACLENPVSVIFNHVLNVQYIQPWMFGHGETKKTGLALYNLPFVKPTNIVDGREQRIWKMPPSENRKELRSKTYPGIAIAFAKQWGTPVLGEDRCRNTAEARFTDSKQPQECNAEASVAGSPVREIRTPGSMAGLVGNCQSYATQEIRTRKSIYYRRALE